MTKNDNGEPVPRAKPIGANRGLDEAEGSVSLAFLGKVFERLQLYSSTRNINVSKVILSRHPIFGDVVRVNSISPFGEDDVSEVITCYIDEDGVLSVEMAFQANEG